MNLYSLTPQNFEDICFEYAKKLYPNKKYTLEHTSFWHDGGKDIEICFYDELTYFKIWAECKRHERNIGLEEIGKNIVLVIANHINKIIFFSVSDITEEAQIVISTIGMNFNFEVSYIYGKYLIQEFQKYPEILLPYFTYEEIGTSILEELEITVSISEYQNTSLRKNCSSTQIYLKNGDVIYLYIHIKNLLKHRVWNINIELIENSGQITFDTLIKQNESVSSKSDLIIEFKGKIIEKNVPIIELPSVIIEYADERDSVKKIYRSIDLPKLNLSKCKNYPLVGENIYNFLNDDINELLCICKEGHAGIIDIRGSSGTGKTRLSKEIKNKLILQQFCTYHFDCRDKFDYDLIRNIFCILMGLPLDRNKINFTKESIKQLISICSGSKDFVEILTEFLVDNVVSEKNYYYLLDAFVYFMCNPVNAKSQLIIIDNIQKADISILRFLMRTITRILNCSCKVIIVLIYNTEQVSIEHTTALNEYLDFMECKKFEYSSQIYSFTCKPFSYKETKLLLKTSLFLNENENFLLNSLVNQAGNTPFEIIMMFEYLNQSKIIKWIDSQNWYIAEPEKYKEFIKKCQYYTKNILEKRYKLFCLKSSEKEKKYFKEIVSSILFFRGNIPYDYLEEMNISDEILDNMEETLWIFMHPSEGIQFYHDNIQRYFESKPIFNNNYNCGNKIISWFESKPYILTQHEKKVLFYCYYKVKHYKEAKEIGLQYIRKSIEMLNFSEAIEIGLLLYSNNKIINNDEKFYVEVGLETAYALLRMGNTRESNSIFCTVVPLLIKQKNNFEKNYILVRLHNAVNSYIQSDYYGKALEFLFQMESLDFITQFYRFIIEDRKAVSKLYLGEYMEADKYFATALTMAKKKNDNFWLSTIYEDIGNSYIYNYTIHNSEVRCSLAIEAWENAIQYYEPQNDNTTFRKAAIYVLQTIKYIILNNLTDAFTYSENAVQECHRVGQNYILTTALNLQALVYLKDKQLNKSFDILQACFHSCELLAYYSGQYITSNNLGVVAYLQGNYSQALQYFEISKSISNTVPINTRHYAILANLLLVSKKSQNLSKYQEFKKECNSLGSKQLLIYQTKLEQGSYNNFDNIITLLEYEGCNYIY